MRLEQTPGGCTCLKLNHRSTRGRACWRLRAQVSGGRVSSRHPCLPPVQHHSPSVPHHLSPNCSKMCFRLSPEPFLSFSLSPNKAGTSPATETPEWLWVPLHTSRGAPNLSAGGKGLSCRRPPSSDWGLCMETQVSAEDEAGQASPDLKGLPNGHSPPPRTADKDTQEQ